MPVLLMGELPYRMLQVLKDFLPNELALIDTEMADDIVTPPILESNYFPYDQRVFGTYPALSFRTTAAAPVEVRPFRFGSRVDAKHKVEIMVHITSTQGNFERLQALSARYAAGIIRVLGILHYRLDTLADPRDFVENVEWLDPLQFSPLPPQSEGAIVRTVTVPLSVRLREVREGTP